MATASVGRNVLELMQAEHRRQFPPSPRARQAASLNTPRFDPLSRTINQVFNPSQVIDNVLETIQPECTPRNGSFNRDVTELGNNMDNESVIVQKFFQHVGYTRTTYAGPCKFVDNYQYPYDVYIDHEQNLGFAQAEWIANGITQTIINNIPAETMLKIQGNDSVKYQYQVEYMDDKDTTKFISFKSNTDLEKASSDFMKELVKLIARYANTQFVSIDLNVWVYDGMYGQGASKNIKQLPVGSLLMFLN